MDIKDIIEMWDDIDVLIADVVFAIAERAGNKIDDEDELESRMYAHGLIGDVRENIVSFLETQACKFPTVDCDY